MAWTDEARQAAIEARGRGQKDAVSHIEGPAGHKQTAEEARAAYHAIVMRDLSKQSPTRIAITFKSNNNLPYTKESVAAARKKLG